jgi:hypothetical protein
MRAADVLGPLCAVLVSAAACGGDDDIDSGVDPDKTLEELSNSEVMDLCESTLDRVADAFVTIFCFTDAIAESQQDPDADCETLAEECLDDPPSSDDELACEIDPETFDDELPACAAEITVAEMEDCFTNVVQELEQAADEISCDSVPVPPVFAELCMDIVDQCPDLFE